MTALVRTLIYGVLVVALVFVGWKVYLFFSVNQSPVITVSGIAPDGYCVGDAPLIIRGTGAYKIADLRVQLDGKPVVAINDIGSSQFERTFVLPKTLQSGRHLLRIDVADASYGRNKSFLEHVIVLDNTPLQIAFVQPFTDFKVLQGRALRVQIQANKPMDIVKVRALAGEYQCIPEMPGSLIYECFIPIPCEESPSEYRLSVEASDRAGARAVLEGVFQVVSFPFKRQVLRVGQEKLKQEAASGEPQQQLEIDILQCLKQSPDKKLWRGNFLIPMEMTGISCEYGVRRVTQEKGCYAHRALDLVGVPKCVVWAPQDGKIIIKNRYEHSGNTIVIDHGLGVFTLLFHLDTLAPVQVGEDIRKGNPVGTMGMTGYATGYHLHWEMRINNIPVDPMQWTKDAFCSQ